MSFPKYPAYKPSGAEWLGDVPAHWEIVQSRRYFANRNEKSIAGEKQLTASQKHGVVYQADFMELEGQKVVQVIVGADILKHAEPNDFVISMRSFQGGIEWCGLRGSISSAYVMLVPNSAIWSPFYRYLFKSSLYIQALQATTNLVRDGQALRFSNFAQVALPLLPIDEQQQIATFLDHETAKTDALIAEQEKLIALLAEKRQATISHAVTHGLNPNAPMNDSGVAWLGVVPAHWKLCRLKQLIEQPLMYGANEAADDQTDSNPRFVRITDIDERGQLRVETFRSLPPEVAAPYMLSRGDILFARSGATVGKTFIYRDTWGACCFAGYLIRAHINQRLMSPDFLYIFCQSLPYWQYIGSEQIQATIQNVSAERYGELVVPVPSLEEQRAICKFHDTEATRLDTLRAEAERAIALLKERRSALIAAAVTGQIDVRGWSDN